MELVYLESSDLNHIRDLMERKTRACEKAGLNVSDAWVAQMMEMKDIESNKSINELIIEFLITQNSNRYIAWFSNNQLFWKIQKELMKSMEDDTLADLDKQAKLSIQADALLERMDSQAKKLFLGEKETNTASIVIRKMVPAESRVKRRS